MKVSMVVRQVDELRLPVGLPSFVFSLIAI